MKTSVSSHFCYAHLFFSHHLSLCSQFWSTYAFIMLLCSFASPHPILPKSRLSNSVVLIEFCHAPWCVKRACRSTTEGVPAAIAQQNNSDSNPTRPFQILQQLLVGGCVIVSYRDCSVYTTLLMTQSCCCGHLSKKTAAFSVVRSDSQVVVWPKDKKADKKTSSQT